MKQMAYDLLERVRQQQPVVHHLTNWVTIYDCAQVVKSLGASPVMAHAVEEAAEMSQIASALVLNIGTLTVDFVEAMKLAARSANKKGIPVVLDVCGAGATALRDRKCLELINEVRIDVIKGNASEVARVSGESVKTRGVDATEIGGDMALLAEKLGGSAQGHRGDYGQGGYRDRRQQDLPHPEWPLHDVACGRDRVHGRFGDWSFRGG